MKYDDLKCEHCNGLGEKEKFVEPYGDSSIICSFCNGTGIDENQLNELFYAQFTISMESQCSNCGCSYKVHRYNDRICPDYNGGKFNGWLETKFVIYE